MRLRSATAGLTAVILLTLAPGAAPGAPPDEGEVFDRKSFSGAIPQDFRGSSDLPDCEFNRYSKDGRHVQHIYSGEEDRCDDPTEGAPRKGDVSIYRRFDVNGGQVYRAFARAWTSNPHNARAVVKLIYFDTQQEGRDGVAECWDRTSSTEPRTLKTGRNPKLRKGLNGNPAPEVTDSGGCVAPDRADGIAVHFRVRAVEVHAYGKAILSRLMFGRCRDNGDCSNLDF